MKKKKEKSTKSAPVILDAEFSESTEHLPEESQEESQEEHDAGIDQEIEQSEVSSVEDSQGLVPITGHQEASSSAEEFNQDSAADTALVSTGYQTHIDPLKQYLKEVSRYPLLSIEEEMDLISKLRNEGDLDAAKHLVRANLRLVVKIAMEYRNSFHNILDLIQEGNVGLMKAVSKFDPNKGAKLSYYAGWWIRSYILKYILDNFRLVRVGTTQAQKKLFFNLMREKERLEAQGLALEPKFLADKFNVKEKDVVEMNLRLGSHGAEMSLNNAYNSSNDENTRVSHLDMLVDEKNSHLEDELEQAELKKILRENLGSFVKTLKEKELAVFNERLNTDNPKTLQEVADLFGLTRERARQIEVQVIEKLKSFYKQYF